MDWRSSLLTTSGILRPLHDSPGGLILAALDAAGLAAGISYVPGRLGARA